MGSKLYYNMHNSDEMRDAIPGLVSEVSAAHGGKPAFLAAGDATAAGAPSGRAGGARRDPPRARR